MRNSDRERLIASIVASPAYRLAQEDQEFLDSDAARGARLQLEMMRPEQYLHRQHVTSTVVVFGSARLLPREDAQRQLDALIASGAAERDIRIAQQRLKYSHYYEEARAFARRISEAAQCADRRELVIVTGGGPGIMEAANRGAYEADGCSLGFNIQLPREQKPNPYITPGLAFRFHYFAMRKMHFMLRAQALVAFPGGYGTMDELFEALTLVQTGKVKPIPIVLVGREYWERAVNFEFLVEEGFIDEGERRLANIVDTGLEAAEQVLTYQTQNPAAAAPPLREA